MSEAKQLPAPSLDNAEMRAKWRSQRRHGADEIMLVELIDLHRRISKSMGCEALGLFGADRERFGDRIDGARKFVRLFRGGIIPAERDLVDSSVWWYSITTDAKKLAENMVRRVQRAVASVYGVRSDAELIPRLSDISPELVHPLRALMGGSFDAEQTLRATIEEAGRGGMDVAKLRYDTGKPDDDAEERRALTFDERLALGHRKARALVDSILPDPRRALPAKTN